MFAINDPFTLNDVCSPWHEWEGVVVEVTDDGCVAQLWKWVGERCQMTWVLVESRQMESSVYLGGEG